MMRLYEKTTRNVDNNFISYCNNPFRVLERQKFEYHVHSDRYWSR